MTREYLKIDRAQLESAVMDSECISEVVRKLGKTPVGGTITHYRNRIDSFGIDRSHFLGKSFKTNRHSTRRKAAIDILTKRDGGGRAKAHHLRRALIEFGRPYQCECCGVGGEWMGHPMTLDVDHINENWLDDRAENLTFLCPNCHSQKTRNLIST